MKTQSTKAKRTIKLSKLNISADYADHPLRQEKDRFEAGECRDRTLKIEYIGESLYIDKQYKVADLNYAAYQQIVGY